MPDMKEKQPIKKTIKEHQQITPSAPIRRGVKPVVAKTKQQIIEASRGAETEDQRSQQNAMEIPNVPRPYGAKKVKEYKTEPKTRNYIENLQHQQNQQRNAPKAGHNKRHTESVDIKLTIEPETTPVNLPQQGSQAFVESQGRNATRKKLVQKQAVRDKNTAKNTSTNPKPARQKSTDQIKTGIKSTDKRQVASKAVGRTIKTKSRTGKVPKEKASVKSIKAPAPKPPQASMAVQKAARQGKKSATQTMKKSAKQAAKSVEKAMAASVKSLAAILGTGGVVVVAVILVLMLVGGLLASPFGIFFSSDADNDLSIQQVMGQCNAQLSQQITDIENSVPHDELEQTGQTALWKEVLAVYAVKVTTDPEHPLEVVTMDEERAELLREIFFAMNTVDYFTEIYTEEVTV